MISRYLVVFVFLFVVGACNSGPDPADIVSIERADELKTQTASSGGSKTLSTAYSPSQVDACLTASEARSWAGGVDDPIGLKQLFDDLTSPVVSLGGALLIPSHMTNTTGIIVSALSNRAPSSGTPICGNWCGQGHPAAGRNPPVTDPLDAICRAHDLCYRDRGMYDCGCDQTLVDSILANQTFIDLNNNGKKIVTALRSSPCFNGCKVFEGHRICGDRRIR